jgi:predicted RNA-binding Zn-ribbon protein involved in translation (DUF1610 family)
MEANMEVVTNCKNCGEELTVDDGITNPAPCPRCGKDFRIGVKRGAEPPTIPKTAVAAGLKPVMHREEFGLWGIL